MNEFELNEIGNVKEIDYFKIDAISNSKLGLIKYAPYKYNNYEEKTTDSMVFGSALHTYFLEQDKFYDVYVVVDCSMPTPDKVKIIQEYVSWKASLSKADAFNNDDDALMIIYYKFYKGTTTKDPFEKRKKDLETAKAIIDENRQYFTIYMEHVLYGKIPLDVADFNKITYLWNKHSVGNLSGVLQPDIYKTILDYELSDDITVYSELEILWTLGEVTNHESTREELVAQYKIDLDTQLKSKLDRVIVDRGNKRVFLVDLKTTSKSIEDFNDSYNHYNYHRQLAFYANALHKFMPELFLIEQWEVIICIVPIEVSGPQRALICEINDNDLQKGTLEFISLMQDLCWHIREDKWEFTRSVYEKGLTLFVKSDKEENNDSRTEVK